MRGRRKPFVVYVGGLTRFRLVPRGLRGWTQFAIWLALTVPAVIWLDEHLDSKHEKAEFMAGVVIFILGTVAWLVGGVWWMLARAEVVNIVEVHRARQYERMERERAKRRGGGREV